MKVMGWVLVILSLFFVGASVTELITGPPATDPEPTEPAVLVGLLLFFAATGYGGWQLTRRGSPSALSVHEREQRMLALAAASGGRLTLAEAAFGTQMGVDAAKQTLNALVNSGVADTWLHEGEAVYVFTGLQAGIKAAAQDPFDPKQTP
jgi:hypothetical protein